MASGGRSTQIPYKLIGKDQVKWINSGVLPADANFKKPRDMDKNVLIEVFNHLIRRQELYGAEGAFSFKYYKSGPNALSAKYTQSSRVEQIRRRRPKRIRQVYPLVGISNPNPGSHPIATEMDHNQRAPSASDFNAPGLILVMQEEMEALHQAGATMPLPANGPADGPPQYLVPTNIYQRMEEAHPTSNSVQCLLPVLDPALLTPGVSYDRARPGPGPSLRMDLPSPHLTPDPLPLPLPVLTAPFLQACTPSPTPTPTELHSKSSIKVPKGKAKGKVKASETKRKA